MSRADIEAGEKRWLEAMNGGDAAGTAAQYADDGRLLPPNMDILSGREAIEAFCKGFTSVGARLSFDLLTVHDSGDLNVAVGTYTLDFQPPGMDAQHDTGKYIEVWRRGADGQWLIIDDMFNSSLPLPGA